MTNLCIIQAMVLWGFMRVLKSSKIFLINFCITQAMVLWGVMYECKSYTIKKDECWRIYAFKLWCCRRLLRISWTTRKLKQLILKEFNPKYSLKGLLLKMKLQYLGHLMWRADSSLEDFDAGQDRRQKKRTAADEIYIITDTMDLDLSTPWEIVEGRESAVLPSMVLQSWTLFSD